MTGEAPSGSKGAWLLGYGTLISAASLSKDIGAGAVADKVFRPVVVAGFKRLFNVRPDHYESSSVLSTDGVERGAMNVQAVAGASFNGVLFRVTTEELSQLDRRERYYDRIQVPVRDFDTDRELGEAFVYSAAPGSQWVIDDPGRLMPLWRDIELARTGSHRLSRRFGLMFDATTYLADGTTLVSERYGDLRRYRELLPGREEPGRREPERSEGP